MIEEPHQSELDSVLTFITPNISPSILNCARRATALHAALPGINIPYPITRRRVESHSGTAEAQQMRACAVHSRARLQTWKQRGVGRVEWREVGVARRIRGGLRDEC